MKGGLSFRSASYNDTIRPNERNDTMNVKDLVKDSKAIKKAVENEMEISKVSEPNPSYFISADKVHNWFEEPEEDTTSEAGEYLSLNDTMADIEAVPEGKAILDGMMAMMNSKTAGGMGEGVKIPKAMQAIIARQPLKKLIQQGGMDIDSPEIKKLEMALSKIKKVKGS